ncbi:selenouridine synthase SelU-like subunit [Methanocaldococcus indicus]|uniref:selenouridine synthase SelU-like subunit n=1 Tax=Methanocaldococcus indicus TaxID=213231 RepID=UPI003C6DADE8
MIIFGLFGKTGCGKTEILRKLKKYHPVIDIEECANTRGSVLGNLYHLKQRNQEEFEKELYKQIKEAEKRGYCIVEYEGRFIGGVKRLKIPELLANLGNYTYKILIECPYECQIKRLVRQYTPKNEKEKRILISRFKLLKKSLKKEEILKAIDEAIKLIENDDYYNAAMLIEEKLYRFHYLRTLKKIQPDLVVYIEDNNLDKYVKIIDDFIKSKLLGR